MTIIEDWITFLENHDEIMQQMIGEHSRLLIVDSNLTIAYFRDFNSNIPIPLEVGQKLPESSSSGIALRHSKIVRRIVPVEVYGLEVLTISIPFQDKSGCLNIAYNIATAHSISHSIKQIISATKEITTASQIALEQFLAMENKFSDVRSSVQNTNEETKNLSEIYSFIKTIADQLQFISINALIEATHAKEHGRGFAIVAKEVRKLAELTTNQIKDIYAIIEKIAQNSADIEVKLDNFHQFIEAHKGMSTEISKSTENVVISVEELQENTNKLLKLEH